MGYSHVTPARNSVRRQVRAPSVPKPNAANCDIARRTPAGRAPRHGRRARALTLDPQQILQPLEYVTLASVSKGKQGMILGSTFHVETAPNVSNPQPNWVEGW